MSDSRSKRLRSVECETMENWIKSKDKKKFTYFINGDYGVGKTYFTNKCLNKSSIEVLKLDNGITYDITSIKNEYERLIKKIELYSNIRDYEENNEKIEQESFLTFALLIDQNEYFSLFENKKLIRSLVLLNHENKKNKILIFIVCNDTNNLYSSIDLYSELLIINPFSLEHKRGIFGICSSIYDNLLCSTDNLHILKNKLKMKKIKMLKNYEINNENSTVYIDVKKSSQTKEKILKLLNTNFTSGIIKYLSSVNFNYKNIELYIQENFYNQMLTFDNYVKTKEKKDEFKDLILRINKVNKLTNFYKSMIDSTQNWALMKYIKITNTYLLFYYLIQMNLHIKLDIFNFNSVRLNNKLLVYKRNKKYHDILSYRCSNNENYHVLLIMFLLYKYTQYKNGLISQKVYKKILERYKINSTIIKQFTFIVDKKINLSKIIV